MKYRISMFFVGVVLVISSSVSVAQMVSEEVVLEQIELARVLGQRQTRAVIELNLPMTVEERDAFGPLYEDYASGKSELNDRLLAIIVEYSEYYNNENIDDRIADRLMKDYFSLEKDMISFKQKQFRKFKRVLPTVKVVQFFQLDNKIDTLTDVGLAASVPLILE